MKCVNISDASETKSESQIVVYAYVDTLVFIFIIFIIIPFTTRLAKVANQKCPVFHKNGQKQPNWPRWFSDSALP